MLQRGNNIGFNKIEQAATLQHNVCHFLRSKFGDRIISRDMQHHWPPYSPDLSPLDYYFWSQCTQYVKKEKPKNICDLRRRVNRFAENIDEEALRKMVWHNRKRAAPCIDSLGGHLEQLL